MMEIITAIYEDGVLRPLEPVNLVEHQTVRLQVIADEKTEIEKAIQALVAAGKLTPPPRRLGREPLSEEERHRRAEQMGQRLGKPVSEIIIEERGDW